jgi:hypothetical protein
MEMSLFISLRADESWHDCECPDSADAVIRELSDIGYLR